MLLLRRLNCCINLKATILLSKNVTLTVVFGVDGIKIEITKFIKMILL
jgi:hypothetical protein